MCQIWRPLGVSHSTVPTRRADPSERGNSPSTVPVPYVVSPTIWARPASCRAPETISALGRARQSEGFVELFVHTHVREDALDLFGFATDTDRRTFRLLLGIPNVGPKTALGVLSALSVSELGAAIAAGDLRRLSGLRCQAAPAERAHEHGLPRGRGRASRGRPRLEGRSIADWRAPEGSAGASRLTVRTAVRHPRGLRIRTQR